MDWKGFQSDWLTLCHVQSRELVQLAGDLMVPGSTPPAEVSLSYNGRSPRLEGPFGMKYLRAYRPFSSIIYG